MLKHTRSNEKFSEKSLGAKGFTLIEMLVVIIILGILAAVVVFAVGNIRERSDRSACKTQARTLRTAAAAGLTQDPTVENEAGLVTANLLDKESPNFDYTITGGGTATEDITVTLSGTTPGKCKSSDI